MIKTENFDKVEISSPAVQRFALRWIKLAKQPATRARRIEQTAQLAARNERVPGS